ncbi:MAG TPA: hypothetical protein VIH90_08275 [Candidatus Saccharimonadales bacterium]
MSLKKELQALEPKHVKHVAETFFSKSDSLVATGRTPDLQATVASLMHNYPGLNAIQDAIFADAERTGKTDQQAGSMTTGAMWAIHILMELAEIQELPRI